MTPTSTPKKNGAPSGFFRSYPESYFKQDAQISRTIRSFYLLAKSVVLKVSGIENNKKRRLILVVDDEPLTFWLIDEFLQEANLNFEMKTAITAENAYDVARAITPDLIITDWLLPEMDGLELIRKLKSNPATRDIPIIMATGVVASNEEFDLVLKTGAIDYIRKPLDYGELSSRVKAAFTLSDSLKEVKHQRDSIHIKNQFVNFLIESAPNPIFYMDKWGRLMGCNKNFELLFAKTKEEIVGKHVEDILSKPIADILEGHFSTLMVCDCIDKFEMELSTAEGPRHLLFSFSGFGNTSVEGAIGSITDVTEIVQSGKETISRLEITHRKEKEQINSSVEKLQTELDFKQREAAMQLQLLIHSRNVKEKLIEGVNKLQPYLTPEGKSKLFSLLKQLKWEVNEEDDLGIEKKFDEANAGLYSLLEKCCPEITKNEKRLCAYLKMNHCASDIAKITDKSLNSINVALARLRAKLQLPNTKDLRIYLNEFDFSNRVLS